MFWRAHFPPVQGPWVLPDLCPNSGHFPSLQDPHVPPLSPTPAVPPATAPDDSQEQEQVQEGPADIHSHCRDRGDTAGSP